MKSHYLKTWPEFFKEIKLGSKPFEVRKNDRDFERDFCVIALIYIPNP
jgi:hypothetical protein